MMWIRALLAVGMVVVGAIVLVRMLSYPIAQTFTGVILGIALIALGLYRLRQLLRLRHGR